MYIILEKRIYILEKRKEISIGNNVEKETLIHYYWQIVRLLSFREVMKMRKFYVIDGKCNEKFIENVWLFDDLQGTRIWKEYNFERGVRLVLVMKTDCTDTHVFVNFNLKLV